MSTIFEKNLETAWPINAEFHVEPSWEGGMKVCINGPGYMTQHGGHRFRDISKSNFSKGNNSKKIKIRYNVIYFSSLMSRCHTFKIAVSKYSKTLQVLHN